MSLIEADLGTKTDFPDVKETRRVSTTLGEVLGLKSEDKLRLLSSRVKIKTFDSPDSTIYSVSYTYRAFYGQELIDLLTSARPHKSDETEENQRSQNKEGIIDDWSIADPSEPEISEVGSQLVRDHAAHLEPFWSEFVDFHLRDFLQAVKALSFEEQEGLFVPQAWKLVKKSYAIANAEKLLVEMINKDYENGEKARSSLNALRLMLIDSPRMPQKSKDDLIRVGLKDLIIIDDSVPGQYDWPKSIEGSSITIDYLGGDIFRLRADNGSQVTVSIEQGRAQEVERFILNPQDKAIIPWVLWSKDKNTRKRQYMNSNVPQEFLEGVDDRANTLLGLVVATSFSPRERDRLPEHRGLPNKKYSQEMLEAQIPLLISMRRKRILKGGSFFKTIERFVS